MIVDVANIGSVELHQTLLSVVTPRPIAWVTTIDLAGRVNLAPFSFFNAVSGNPPVVVFSPALKRDGSKKDTHANLDEVGEFVVNVAVAELAQQVNLSSSEIPRGESVVELTGLNTLPSVRVRPPRIAESPVHLECKLRQIIPLGDGPGAGQLVVGDVVLIHISDAVLGPDGRVDPRKLQTIARLGGNYYCRATDLFELPRP